MPENKPTIDPTFNVKELVDTSIRRLDDIRQIEVNRITDRIDANDVKYQMQFNAAKDNVSIALIAQEKAVAAALDAAKEATSKSEISMDKRFDLLSKKIDELMEIINKNTGAQGIYVTHNDLNNSFDKFRIDIETMLRPVITKVEQLSTVQNTNTGKGEGMTRMYGWIVGGVLFLITIASFIINFSG